MDADLFVAAVIPGQIVNWRLTAQTGSWLTVNAQSTMMGDMMVRYFFVHAVNHSVSVVTRI